MITIGQALTEDREAVFALLRRNALPLEGLTDHFPSLLVARQNDQIVGSVALEIYADGGLLRSFAVSRSSQGNGVGRRLIEAVVHLAERHHLPALYLLTTTASEYFRRFGFEKVDRQQVPASVQTSAEFLSACPASATVMRRRLRVA